jgi:Raf kinase inhibitor-like YbhB/YbcL family protein
MTLCVGVAAALFASVLAVGSVAAASFTLTSPAFRPGGMIPKRFTCDGADVSPPLRWAKLPAGTRSVALSVIDLDAHGFVHWLAWGLPPARRGLTAGQHLPHQAVNSFGRLGYGGPCPPRGTGHRYQFSLYALNARVRPPFTAHVIGMARLIGVYRRR